MHIKTSSVVFKFIAVEKKFEIVKPLEIEIVKLLKIGIKNVKWD